MDTQIIRPIRRLRPALAALVATLLLATTPLPGLADPDRSAADLRRTAITMGNLGELAEAADFLVETVEKLAADDPERDDNLRLAARLYHHAGNLESSWRTMVNAGVAAYSVGDAKQAGHDLVDAAEVASQAGNSIRAWNTVDKVGFVLRTSELSADDRLAILDRVQVFLRESRG